jgi:hypothetical protein
VEITGFVRYAGSGAMERVRLAGIPASAVIGKRVEIVSMLQVTVEQISKLIVSRYAPIVYTMGSMGG